jgi:PAN domain-containing protein/TIR domain-containing protein
MPKIVISYRRSDSDAIAGRIRDRLANRYGEDSVFMDIDSIPLGIDFRQHVKGALSESNVVIAVVGTKWLGPRHRGQPRIQQDTDPVRIEIETALASGIRLIPVLVNNASMPKPSDLPASLEQFAYHNAAEIDAGRDFHQHMDRLIREMDQIAGVKAVDPPTPAPSATVSPPAGSPAMPVQHKRLLIAGLLGAVVAAVVAAIVGVWPLREQPAELARGPQPVPAPKQQPTPPPVADATAPALSVRSAFYGDNCPTVKQDDTGKVDVTALLAEFCKKEPSRLCRYPISQQVLGDPVKGCAKALRVRYACGSDSDLVMKEAFVPPEAAGNYALLQCGGAVGVVRSTFEDGVDRAGSDYDNIWLPRPEPQLCRDACLDDARCRAWTYVAPGVLGPAAACWFKAVVPQPAKRPCCVSGIIE